MDIVPAAGQASGVAGDACRQPATLLEKSGCRRFGHASARGGQLLGHGWHVSFTR